MGATTRRRGAEGAEVKTADELNALSERIIGAALKVHSAVGPGLLESVYEACLAYELRRLGLTVRTQVALPLIYESVIIEKAYRVDLIIEGSVIVELKTVTSLLPIHEAQLLTHLRLSHLRLGLLLNFYGARLRDGIRRIVNNLSSPHSSSAPSPLSAPLR
jgi:GxxExxY protein